MFQIIYAKKFFLSPKLVKTEVTASTHIKIARIFSEVQFITIVFVDPRSRTNPLPQEKDQLGCYITKVGNIMSVLNLYLNVRYSVSIEATKTALPFNQGGTA